MEDKNIIENQNIVEEKKITSKAKNTVLVSVAITFAIIGILWVIYINIPNNTDVAASENFVKCLNNSGAVMYGTSWCHYCQQQKTMLAPYFEYIKFVDCDVNAEGCFSNGVSSYPTWIIDGTTHVGLQSMQQLSSITGCKL